MKSLDYILLILLCLAVTFTSCNDDSDDQPDEMGYTVIPGQGINDLEIGDPGSEVEIKLGTGFQPIVNVGGSGNATYNYYNASEGIDVIFGQQSSGDLEINDLPIKSFYLFDNFGGMTAEGIKIGSTKAEVIAAFGQPDIVDMGANVYNIGLIITYDNMDQVRNMTITKI